MMGVENRTSSSSSVFLDGKYIFGDTIGSGGFGKVKVATHVLTGEKVAIKIVDKASVGEDLPRIQTELTALKTLSHQNICRLYQAVETEEKFFFVLEYCAGGELFDYIVKKESLPDPEARHFFRQIVAAVSYIHGRGVAHRDLKPENLLLTEDLQVKLIDFGLCAFPNRGLGSVLETCCGSPAYAAPELIAGTNYLGSEADIWSMGVLLYALLCGFLPFEDENIQILYQKIAEAKYVEPPWLSSGSRGLLRAMLQRDPKRRISVDQLLVHPWVVGDYAQPLKWKSIYDENLVDEECAREMSRYYEVKLEELVARLNSWAYDDLTATYFLLLERKRRRRPVVLPLASRSLGCERKSPGVLHSPTIHASLEKGLDTVDLEWPTPRTSLSHRNRKAMEDSPVVTPVSKKIRNREREDKENVERRTKRSNDATVNRPKSVYSARRGTPATTPLTPCQDSGQPRPNWNQETPLSIQLRAQSLDGLDEEEEEEETKPRSPRSQHKTPRLGRRMFASVERKVDRMMNLLTPRRGRLLHTPLRLDNAKEMLVNVSTTSSNDPQLVLNQLLRVFQEKGIVCERHGWKIHGKTKTRAGRLTLELEVVYVEHLDVVGVKRKRLSGDSFMYKNVCQEILNLASL